MAVKATGLHLSYGSTHALRGASLCVDPGESVAIMGASGSGKTSLMGCLAGLLQPSAGRLTVLGQDLHTASEATRRKLRLRNVGMVFQYGELLPELTIRENVMLPLQLLGTRNKNARQRADELLERFDIAAVATQRPQHVSGGQAQRAAVARALATKPPLIMADEPTGALDTAAGETVMLGLTGAAAESGASLIVITHDHRVAAYLDKHLTMSDGSFITGAGGW
ncbi:ABC transporter ATP-binding protein [Ornithinimicrobium sp. INDO-MA30-4]|uniref:ABC transporter ATP-binding protein n=1 Tax=Ornithinimicrobium sp. INDO-MA30-4 TaxID=2908651 RepID=UPI001F25AB72|nr:ABC transporter ATP-binding protein [Ornithinimicrobium sp. INDO-MA30-4]UJH70352.1 ABC transporter ATP-binding protein [Ornithinimicrobium sp. INDO-MA30-4]